MAKESLAYRDDPDSLDLISGLTESTGETDDWKEAAALVEKAYPKRNRNDDIHWVYQYRDTDGTERVGGGYGPHNPRTAERAFDRICESQGWELLGITPKSESALQELANRDTTTEDETPLGLEPHTIEATAGTSVAGMGDAQRGNPPLDAPPVRGQPE